MSDLSTMLSGRLRAHARDTWRDDLRSDLSGAANLVDAMADALEAAEKRATVAEARVRELNERALILLGNIEDPCDCGDCAECMLRKVTQP